MGNVNTLLGGDGTTFDQAIDSFPLCCPSRATNLTGQYAHNHGVLHNAPPFGGFIQLDGTSTLPVWLQAAGYRTMHVGRYLNGYEAKYGIPPGWTDWVGLPHSAAFNYFAWKAFDHGVREGLSGRRPPGRVPDRLRDAQGRGADRRRLGRRPALLPVALVHGAAPGRPARPRRPAPPRHALPGPAPPRRVRRRADAAPAELQRAQHVRQAAGRGRPAAAVARARGRRRGELAPGERGADGGGRGRLPDRGGAAPQRPARQHADRVPVGQRLHARRAPRARREGPALRGVDPRADRPARARACPGAGRPPARGATWT